MFIQRILYAFTHNIFIPVLNRRQLANGIHRLHCGATLVGEKMEEHFYNQRNLSKRGIVVYICDYKHKMIYGRHV